MKTNQTKKNIPNGWPLTKLTDVGVFSKGAEISKEQLSESGHNAIRYGELYTRHNIKVDKIYSFISDEIVPLTKKIKYGDILFAGSGETNDEIGKSATYLLKEDCYAGGDVIIFRPKNANSLFLSYFLNFGEGRKKLRELGQGQSIVHIYKSDMEEIKLHLPSLPEQNRIVSVLETWDKSIKNLNNKIEIKKQIKKGLMQDLLTGKKRLSGFKDKWQIKKLVFLEDLKIIKLGRGEVISKTDIKNFPGENPIYSSSVHNNALFGKYSKHMFDEELISWSVDGGGHFFHRPKHKFSITNVSGFMRVDTNIFNYIFLASQLQLLHSKKYFDYQFKAHPSVIREEYYISYPDIKEQNAIANILTTADKEITELEKKLSIIKNQKKFLLNNLITGAIRTPENLSVKS